MIRQDITWYIAGPMSGLPQFNYPLFMEAARVLRADGYSIVSPAELDSEHMQRLAMASKDGNLASMEKSSGETWGDVLARDVKLVSDKVGGIITLPNWEKSRGARLEVFVGLLQVGIRPFAFANYLPANSNRPARVGGTTPDWIREVIRSHMP